MELSRSNIEKISQEKAFLLFQETKTPKKHIFFKRNLFLYFRKRKPRKKILIFQETELSYISSIEIISAEAMKIPLLAFVSEEVVLEP